jgi:hypothetical protein
MSEAMIAELASNATMGLLNLRSEQYGKKVGSIESMIPAPLTAAAKVGSGLLYAPQEIMEEGKPESLMKAAETYVPGVSNVDRLYRLGTGDRLLTGDGKGEGLFDMINNIRK